METPLTRSERGKLAFSEVPPHLLGSDQASRQALLLRLRVHSFLAPDDLLAEEAAQRLIASSVSGEGSLCIDDSVRSLARTLGLAPLALLKIASGVAEWVEHGELPRQEAQEPLPSTAPEAEEEQMGEEEDEWVGPTPDHERLRIAGDGGALSVQLDERGGRTIASQVNGQQPERAIAGQDTGIYSPDPPLPIEPPIGSPRREAEASGGGVIPISQAGGSSQTPASMTAPRRSLAPAATQQQQMQAPTPSHTQHRSAAALLLAEMESEAMAASSGSVRASGALGPAQPRSTEAATSVMMNGSQRHVDQPISNDGTLVNVASSSQLLSQRLGHRLLDVYAAPSVPRPRVVRTTLPGLDRLCGIPDLNVASPSSSSQGVTSSEKDPNQYGLPPGSMLELTGPTGSGKTCLAAQMSLQYRFDALVRTAAARHGDGADSSGGATSWEEVVAGAASVWMIDTEGSLLPSRLHALAISFLASRPSSELTCFERFFGDEGASSATARKELLLALLGGIALSRALTLAQLVAHLTLAFPALSSGGAAPTLLDLDERDRVRAPHSTASLIVIDSLSYHLRTPSTQAGNGTGSGGGGAAGAGGGSSAVAPTTAEQNATANAQLTALRQREERKQVIEVLRLLGQTMDRQRRRYRQQMRQYTSTLHRPQQDGPAGAASSPPPMPPLAPVPSPPPTLVVTMQMSTKMFSRSGELSNYRSASAVGRLVPSLVGPLPSSSQEGPAARGGGGTRWAEEEEGYLYGAGSGGPRRRAGWGEAGNQETATVPPVPRDDAEAAMLHGERGSVLGRETWRVLLFREREGSRFAQIQGRPPYAALEQLAPRQQPTERGEGESQPSETLGPSGEEDQRWRAWVRFDIDSRGGVVEVPLVGA